MGFVNVPHPVISHYYWIEVLQGIFFFFAYFEIQWDGEDSKQPEFETKLAHGTQATKKYPQLDTAGRKPSLAVWIGTHDLMSIYQINEQYTVTMGVNPGGSIAGLLGRDWFSQVEAVTSAEDYWEVN